MARFNSSDASRIRDVNSMLCTWQEGAPPILPRVLAAVTHMFDADTACAYGVGVSDDGYHLDFLNAVGFDEPPMALMVDRMMRSARVPWGYFKPDRPQPKQRNVVFRIGDMVDVPRSAPIFQLYSKLGVRQHDNMRVLLCEGASLLSWFGLWRPKPFTIAERRCLQAVVPAVQRRLVLERQLGQAALSLVGLTAAMEAIPAVAMILDARDQVVHANAAARQWLLRGRRALPEALAQKEFTVTPLAARGLAPHRLVVHRAPERGAAARLPEMTRRWQLTPREAQVLAEVAAGHANKTIASLLSVGERTIEVHVTSILQKAGVENRATLIARFWSR